jgi:hypothetical protein
MGGDPGSWNRYAYAGGDPINRSDPRGLCVEDGQYNFWDNEEDVPETAGGVLEDFGPGLCMDSSTWVNQVGWGSWVTLNGSEYQVGSGDTSGGGGGDPNDGGSVSPWVYLGNDVGGKPASPQDRTRDTIWMGQGLNALKSFTTNSSPCAHDLSLFGLTSTGVQGIAQSIHLTNLAALSPGAQATFDLGADFTAKQNNNLNFLIYNQNEFWQSTLSQMMGTLLHEVIHFANFSLSDSQIAKTLGVVITPQNDSAISLKLATDCFPGGGR